MFVVKTINAKSSIKSKLAVYTHTQHTHKHTTVYLACACALRHNNVLELALMKLLYGTDRLFYCQYSLFYCFRIIRTIDKMC